MNALRTLFSIALLALAMPVAAQGYLFGMASHSKADTRTAPDTSGSELTGLHAGAGWRFSPYFSAEAAYLSTGHFGSADGLTQWSVKGFGVSAVGTLPISGPWSLVGKVGAYDLEDTVEGSGGRSKSDLGTRPLIAFGGQYHVGDAMHLQLLYQQIKGDDSGSLAKLRMISMGAMLQF